MQWRYFNKVGLMHPVDSTFDLLFGTARQTIRKAFGYNEQSNSGRFPNEDSYDELFDNPEICIRLCFEHELLSEIEILQGEIVFDNIVIKTGADLSATIDNLTRQGFAFQEWDYGFSCINVNLDLGDSDKNGGISNLILWIFLSQNIQKLLYSDN